MYVKIIKIKTAINQNFIIIYILKILLNLRFSPKITDQCPATKGGLGLNQALFSDLPPE
jgi:hypothetical protein